MVRLSAKQPRIIPYPAKKAPALALRPERPKSRDEQIAERQAAQGDVFMREVDDALRQDEMTGFFKRYGIPVAAAVTVGLLGLAGYLWWDHSSTQATGERGEKLVVALDDIESGNLAAADKELTALAGEGSDASAAAAKLARAGIALQQNRKADAVKLYAEVAADSGVPKPYRDLATIREVASSFDDLNPQQVVDRLKPLAVPGNAWFGSAGELVGIAYLKQGNDKLEGPLYAQIARDEKAPETLRRRARQMAGLLGVDAIDDVARAASSGPGGAPMADAPAGDAAPAPAQPAQ